MPDRRFDAVISDIDGCLGPESNDPMDTAGLAQIAEHNRAAIRAADRPVLTVCSGRPQPFAEAMCRVTHNNVLPCVAENGVWIFDPRDGAYVRDPAITAEHLRAVRDATAWIEEELVPAGVVMQPGKVASISLFHPSIDHLRGLTPRLEAQFRARGWPLRVSMTVAWTNCDLAHISKGTGLERFMKLTGLARERLAGIGDMPSDLVMRSHVAFFACPSNAHEEVKRQADYVSPHAEIRGVLDILERVSR